MWAPHRAYQFVGVDTVDSGNKKRRGKERTREEGEKDGGIGKARGKKSKRAGRAREGRRSGRQMAIVTVTQKKEKEGEEGRVRREKGQHITKKWKRRVHQLISEREECEGVTNMEQATVLVVVKDGRTGDTEINRAGSRHL